MWKLRGSISGGAGSHCLCRSGSGLAGRETQEGLALEADLEAGELSHATKFAKHASYRKRRSR
jgi:hypothetical protein